MGYEDSVAIMELYKHHPVIGTLIILVVIGGVVYLAYRERHR